MSIIPLLLRGWKVLTMENLHLHFKVLLMGNSPHGSDVQDMRIGDMVSRMISCKKSESFLNGSVNIIPEPENPVLKSKPGPCGAEGLLLI